MIPGNELIAALGLRLEGEQLAAGVRFVELAKEGSYDVVIGNPPYQGISKTARFEYVAKNYPRGKADLYSAFLERGLELVRDGALSALLTMRGWMFLGKGELRKYLVREHHLRLLGDVDRGAFEDVPDEVLATVMSVFRRGGTAGAVSVAIQPSATDDRARDLGRTNRKRAALLAQVGRYEFDPLAFAAINGQPIVYWWTPEALKRYAEAPKLGELWPAREGLSSANNERFIRKPWEIRAADAERWVSYVRGAEGRAWMAGVEWVIHWEADGLEIRLQERSGKPRASIRNERFYMKKGIAFTTIGSSFAARAYRVPSIFDTKGRSLFPEDVPDVLCAMNSSAGRQVIGALSPGIDFTVADVNRMPIHRVIGASEIFATLDATFGEHEAHRETSVEFMHPGPSRWQGAQAWAQLAVDRPEGAPFAPYAPAIVEPDPVAELSFAIGRAMGRFGPEQKGSAEPETELTLPAGVLFIGPTDSLHDSLAERSVAPIVVAWAKLDFSARKGSLRQWLRKDFFAFHRELYENRPIYLPVSSEEKSFVAWISIHRWTDATLQTLLADHLHPVLRQLDAEIRDVNVARSSSDKKTAIAADKQYAKAKRLRDELEAFIIAVTAL